MIVSFTHSSKTLYTRHSFQNVNFGHHNSGLLFAWPPNSPDLNLIDYIYGDWWTRGCIKRRFEILTSCENALLKNVSGCDQSVINSVFREWCCRLRACVKARGRHFERKLWINYCSLNCIISLKHFWLKFSMHKDMDDCNCTCVCVCVCVCLSYGVT